MKHFFFESHRNHRISRGLTYLPLSERGLRFLSPDASRPDPLDPRAVDPALRPEFVRPSFRCGL